MNEDQIKEIKRILEDPHYRFQSPSHAAEIVTELLEENLKLVDEINNKLKAEAAALARAAEAEAAEEARARAAWAAGEKWNDDDA